MAVTKEFENEIAPFFWVEQKSGASVCLNAGGYLQDIFDARADEGFIGSGYDWERLAQVFLDERLPKQQGKIGFDPEADMFCAYSGDAEALADFIRHFKKACEDQALISELFSRAEPD